MLIAVGLEGTFFQGVFSYIGADLHLRFGLSFTGVGVVIGIFALGGLIYAATVKSADAPARPDRHRPLGRRGDGDFRS